MRLPTLDVDKYTYKLDDINPLKMMGRVVRVVGLAVESNGPNVQLGEICEIFSKNGDRSVKAETIGFRDKNVLLMPFGDLGGVGPDSLVVSTNGMLKVGVGKSLLGRILGGNGEPMDGKGALIPEKYRNVDNDPPNPLTRKRIHEILPLGVKAIDGLLTIGRGQRIGIFAGSGVGKSTLLGMMARNALSDINVITLVGERGREVRDFIERDLGEEGLARSILVVATSDQPSLIRLKAAMVGTAIAEYFREQGNDVLLLMDSLTRFCMAQREIGMSVGEPPVARGYTPSVFALLPRLLERSGTAGDGTITALYTVLVDGDDLNEPISDAVRGILDGHIVLSRDLANNNHYPAIDVLASVSRLMPEIADKEDFKTANKIKSMMAVYRRAQDLINIGAYRSGSNPEIDEAIKHIRAINDFLLQGVHDKYTFEETLNMLRQTMNA